MLLKIAGMVPLNLAAKVGYGRTPVLRSRSVDSKFPSFRGDGRIRLDLLLKYPSQSKKKLPKRAFKEKIHNLLFLNFQNQTNLG